MNAKERKETLSLVRIKLSKLWTDAVLNGDTELIDLMTKAQDAFEEAREAFRYAEERKYVDEVVDR